MKLNRSLLAKVAGIDRIDDLAFDRLESYASHLSEANQKINLISRSANIDREIENQIALSLVLARLFDAPPNSWIDVGSGGGFPVLPLAIIWGVTDFTAVEPIAKKAYFVERTAQDLKLENLRVRANRIEDVIADESSRTWDVVSVKALADIGQSLRWAAKLLSTSGKMITYKPECPDVNDVHMIQNLGFEQEELLNVKELIDSIDLNIITYKKL